MKGWDRIPRPARLVDPSGSCKAPRFVKNFRHIHMKPSLLRSSVLTLAAAGSLLPVSAFALTPQQALNAAIQSAGQAVPLRAVGDMSIETTDRPLSRAVPATTGSFKVSFLQRILSRIAGQEQGEGRFSVDGFRMSGGAGTDQVALDEPIAIQWKTVGTASYVRIEKLPAAIVEGLQQLDVDASKVVGRWIKIDKTELLNEVAPLLPTPVPAAADASNPFKDLKIGNAPIFRVSRIEKKTTDADGHVIIRARIRLNPAVITALQRRETAGIAADDPDRRALLNDIATRYARIHRILATTQFVAEVDQTDGTLKRFETGGRYTEPQKSCEWNTRYGRSICRTTSYRTIKFLGGVSFLKDPGAAVEAPADAIDIKDLLESLKPEEPAEPPVMEEAPAPEELP